VRNKKSEQGQRGVRFLHAKTNIRLNRLALKLPICRSNGIGNADEDNPATGQQLYSAVGTLAGVNKFIDA
jgi:hypothetical protein